MNNLPERPEQVNNSGNAEGIADQDESNSNSNYESKLVLGADPEFGNKRRGNFWTKPRIITGIAISAVLVVAGVGIGITTSNNLAAEKSSDNPDHGPSPIITPSAETPTPDPTPIETETPDPTLEKIDFGVSQKDIAPYLAESQEAFMARPIEERMLVSLAYAEDIQKFASDWYGITNNDRDIFPSSISVNNTPEEIMTTIVYMHRIPYTIRVNNGLVMDLDAANKMMGGNFMAGKQSNEYDYFLGNLKTFKDFGGRAPTARTMAVTNNIIMPTINKSSDLMTDSNGRKYRTINATENNGVTGDEEFYWIIADNGVGMWVQQ